MSRRGIIGLILLGTLSFLVFAVARIPAAVAVPILEDQAGIEVHDPSGTIWSGRFGAVQLPDIGIGPVEWDLSALSLLRARADLDVRADIDSGQARGRVRLDRHGNLQIREARGQVPLHMIRPFLLIEVQELSGDGAFDLEHLEFREMRPWRAEGDLRILDLQLRVQQQAFDFGNFQGQLSGTEGDLRLGFQDAGGDGPWELDGDAEFHPDYSYRVEGRVRAREEAPRHMQIPLQYLGSEDEQGFHRFSFGGSL